MKRIFAYILLLTAFACTDKIGSSTGVDLVDGELVDIQTKGTGSGNTYIFYLVGSQNYYGTYADLSSGKPLSPVRFVEGEPTEDSSAGLRAPNGDYNMFVASPAVPMTVVDGVYGYTYERNVDNVYISAPVEVTVGGVYLSGNFGTVHNVSGYTMRQPRSRLNLKMKCGTGLTSVTVNSVKLKNFISIGHYVPVESRFHYNDSDIVTEESLYPVQGQQGATVQSGQVLDLGLNGQDGSNKQYILSMNYGALNAEGNLIFPMPALEVNIAASNGKQVTFVADLGWNFLPQHVYEFTIVVNSVDVTVSVQVSQWNPNDENSSQIGGPDDITVPFNDNGNVSVDWGWDNVEVEEDDGVI